MCGLTGCCHNNNISFDFENFKKINSLISYRGPDLNNSQEYFNKDYSIKFGHNRLSIIDLNQTGNQPMLSHNGRYSIIYNGEIYNFKEIKNQLVNNYNIQLKGTSDTEILIEFFSHTNLSNFFENIEGMFAFSIYDKKENEIIISRDKIGEKPLYIYFNNNIFGFSSDLKTLINFPNFNKNINTFAVNKFLKLNYIPNPNSIYNNCFKIPPGTYLKINLSQFNFKPINNFNDLLNTKGVIVKEWWKLSNKIHNKKKIKNYSSDNIELYIEKLIDSSVKNQLNSDVPLGTFLSGGIDSSLITAITKKYIEKPNTFTIGFNFKEYDESIMSKKISSYLNTNHYSYNCTKKDLLEIIPKLSDVYSEPFADSSQIPTILISQIASQKVKVILTGDGGDEIFGGYNRYILVNKFWKYINVFPYNFRKIILTIVKSLPKNLVYPFIKIIIKLFNESNLSDKKIEKIINKFLNISNNISYYYNMTNEWMDEKSILSSFDINYDNLTKYFENKNMTFEESMMLADFETYLTDDIFCKIDRASMYNSIETRAPFLNKKLIEEMFHLPLEFKINNGNSKILLKNILKKYLPNNLINKSKYGFAIPLGHWIKNDLKDWVNDILSKDNCNKHNLFNYQIIEKIKKEHFTGSYNHENKLWSLIQFNLWYSKYVD